MTRPSRIQIHNTSHESRDGRWKLSIWLCFLCRSLYPRAMVPPWFLADEAVLVLNCFPLIQCTTSKITQHPNIGKSEHSAQEYSWLTVHQCSHLFIGCMTFNLVLIIIQFNVKCQFLYPWKEHLVFLNKHFRVDQRHWELYSDQKCQNFLILCLNICPKMTWKLRNRW